MPQLRRLIISEAVVAAFLLVLCITFAIGCPAALPLHATMLVAFVAVCTTARARKWSTLIDAAAIVVVLMELYQTVAEPAFIAMHGARDAALAHADRLLFAGRDPALLAQRFASHGVIETLSLVYGIFIPYLWFSILLGCIGRPDEERRLRGVEDFGRFPAGSVLVARTTNPAWTPLFQTSVAVITESGGPLSHGAVTAREVGIPAVMAVRGALSLLQDGERVRVNGTAGTVTVLTP